MAGLLTRTARARPRRSSSSPPRSARARDQRRLAWLLCAPAALALLAVTAYPLGYAAWLSVQRYDLRFPDQRGWVGVENYTAVLGSTVFRDDLLATVVITGLSVAAELVVGLAFALVMHRTVGGRRLVRTSILVPYGLVTVVAAFGWQYAFSPQLSFFTDRAWLGERWSSFAVVVWTEVWKTTPLVSLLLLAGLATVPEEMLEAAEVDGATSWQRFRQVTLPGMRPVVALAVVFCTLDAFRAFDTVFIQTGGANGTETLSMGVYDQLIDRLNLGLGSAFALVLSALTALVALLLVRVLRVDLGPLRRDRR